MTVAVCIPWRPGDPVRERLFAYVREHYLRAHPTWRVVAVDVPRLGGLRPEWSKARACNAAYALAGDPDVVIFADADVIADARVLRRFVGELRTWGQPFRAVARLTEPQTERVFRSWAGEPNLPSPFTCYARSKRTDAGGMVCFRRDAWLTLIEQVGGWDERVIEWGCEDDVLGVYAARFLGGLESEPGFLYHLYHPRAGDRRDHSHYANSVQIWKDARRGILPPR